MEKEDMGIRSRGCGMAKKKGHGQARGRGPVMGIWVFSLLRIYAYMTESPPVSRIKHVHDQSPQGGDMLQKPVVSHGSNCITASHLSSIPKS